jgi:hypothetical protein
MRTTILVKSCRRDLGWLRYCLSAIRKYARDFESILLVLDNDCKGQFNFDLPGLKIIYVEPWLNRYIHQQYIKLLADTWVQTPYILLMDSDTIFTQEVTPRSFLAPEVPLNPNVADRSSIDPRPLWFVRDWDEAEEAQMWKKHTEHFHRREVPFEFMLTLPQLVLRSSLTAFRAYARSVQHRPLERYLVGILPNGGPGSVSFSEFNALGAYCFFKEGLSYHFLRWSALSLPAHEEGKYELIKTVNEVPSLARNYRAGHVPWTKELETELAAIVA